MEEAKHTQRSIVHLTFDGKVYKTFLGEDAKERYQNECRVLRYLEDKECNFVPKVIETDDKKLLLVTTNCGARVDRISQEKQEQIFADLKSYGVRHDDAEKRNLTYRRSDGRFCVIDFEFATILEDYDGEPPPVDLNAHRGADKTQRKADPEHDVDNPYIRRRPPAPRKRHK
ncbi:protein kinase family protein [Puniceicoccus vermicola]|uniref:serine/threonine protein phosphatase n=1 Tax=Puniceicoccus vermicola TaxID=388746 RepID=UPI001C8C3B0C|nr:serine/threonine protein phosphatase [Puniceicoccus vermicola]